MTRAVSIIQARLGSTRLPGKVLIELAGTPMIEHVVARVRGARLLDDIVLATTLHDRDDALFQAALGLGIRCVRGSEMDVLGRYVHAARESKADLVVRITADCPLIDAQVIDLVVATFEAAQPRPDYATNTLVRSYPKGLDVEVFDTGALEQAAAEATTLYQREHVTPYFYENPDKFRLLNVQNAVDYSAYRWTVDTPDDLNFVREIYRRLGRQPFGWREVVALLASEPKLAAINQS